VARQHLVDECSERRLGGLVRVLHAHAPLPAEGSRHGRPASGAASR